MTTLHIEHAISDFSLWREAFARFAAARRDAGVQAERVTQPIDDPQYVVIDLDFASASEAEAFLGFLPKQVWDSPQASPALAGEVRARVLEAAAV
jgi:hypothetical protein